MFVRGASINCCTVSNAQLLRKGPGTRETFLSRLRLVANNARRFETNVRRFLKKNDAWRGHDSVDAPDTHLFLFWLFGLTQTSVSTKSWGTSRSDRSGRWLPPLDKYVWKWTATRLTSTWLRESADLLRLSGASPTPPPPFLTRRGERFRQPRTQHFTGHYQHERPTTWCRFVYRSPDAANSTSLGMREHE